MAKKAATAKVKTKVHDHRVEIRKELDRFTDYVRAALDGEVPEGLADDADEVSTDLGAFLERDVLEIDALFAPGDRDRYRIRFVFTIGGPHVEVIVDSREGVTFVHSWGKEGPEVDAADRKEIDAYGADRAVWERLATEYVENYVSE